MHAATNDRPLVHHVELWMDDLALAEQQWGPVLTALGCTPFQRWANGRSWRLGGSYVVIEQSPALRPGGHDRLRAGINHLALRTSEPAQGAELRSVALTAGWQERTDTGRALHLVDGQGFELELVYDESEPPAPTSALVNPAG
ncbi:glyoxalase [Nocardia sp. NBC_01009]|uniref:glyoxalase n=1 Tax=Nocardia sp. NBC_01009 TaxID=2975996 RepID=UPI00386FBDA2|nr:hypothetical protein OHA42_01380 [Nocardia sp. NBC_01009]